ncbi:MAG: hypothetical protein GX643_17645 [Acidimicrobiales bacterium]|nr:hypothetical protein [Acidimicrobiales bacterium]
MSPTPNANPDEGRGQEEAVHQARDRNENELDRLLAEIDTVRADTDFTTLAHDLIERDREILDRLAE